MSITASPRAISDESSVTGSAHQTAGESDGYYTLKRLTAYSGLGVRTLRTYLSDATYPLPHYRVGGKILVKRSEFDAWIRPFRRADAARVQAMIADVVKGL